MTVRRMLVAGTGFYGYIGSIAEALGRAGVMATVVPYRHARRGWRSWPARLGVPGVRRARRTALLRTLVERGRGADAVLLLRGDLLDAESVRELKAALRVPVVLWLIDTLGMMEDGRSLSAAADLVLCYSRDDASELAALGCHARFFPLAFDPARYHPILGAQQDLDLYYVGSYHPERQVFLEALLQALDGLRLTAVLEGRLYDPLRPDVWVPARRARPRLFATVTNRDVDHAHVNAMTNRARVCLNALPAQATAALNIRAYEICGAGGFQLVTRNPVLGELFEVGREVAAFDTARDAAAAIGYYLSPTAARERQSVAAAGRRRAAAEHSFDHRVADVLKELG